MQMNNAAIQMNVPVLVDDARATHDIISLDKECPDTAWGSWLDVPTLPARGPDEEEEKEL
jgi:hypothetical protein